LSYNEQLRILHSYLIPPDTTMRLDCPFCNHKNTLSVTNDDNRLSWHCFHASCDAKGTEKKRMSMATIKKIFNTEPVTQDDKFNIPEHFKTVYSNERAVKYLQKNNCWESYTWRRADIKYDVRQDRVVFMIKEYDNFLPSVLSNSLVRNRYPFILEDPDILYVEHLVLDFYEDEIKNAGNPYIRYFAVPTVFNFNNPQKDLPQGNWESISQDNILNVSAILLVKLILTPATSYHTESKLGSKAVILISGGKLYILAFSGQFMDILGGIISFRTIISLNNVLPKVSFA